MHRDSRIDSQISKPDRSGRTFLLLLIAGFLAALIVIFNSTFFFNAKSLKKMRHHEELPISKIVGKSEAKSRLGKEISVILSSSQKSSPREKKRILINGAIHGNERGTEVFVKLMQERLEMGTSKLNPLMHLVEFDFVPISNPDGYLLNSRYNINGVNLNRNFDSLWGISRENPGAGPLSEPETKSLDLLFEKRKYFLAIDVHGFVNWIVTPSFLGARELKPKKAMNRRKALKNLTSILSKRTSTFFPQYKVISAASLGDGGAFEDWAFWSRGAYSFCLELETSSHFNLTQNFLAPKPKSRFASKEAEIAKYELFLKSVILDLLKKPTLSKNQPKRLIKSNSGANQEGS